MAKSKSAEMVPRLREDLVVTELPITDPFEGFILSRIDGETTIRDIADYTGATVERVLDILTRLEGLGALGGPPEPPALHTRPPPPPAGPAPQAPAAPSPPKVPQAPRAPLIYDPRELDEEAELDRERKHEILDTFHRLADLNHYEILGLPRDADKKAVRASYFALSKRFHPDTLFGKQLGSFKSKMEKVFDRLTEAYETLGKKRKRAAYDEYLGMQDATRALESGLEEGEAAAESAGGEPGGVEPAGDETERLGNAATEAPAPPEERAPDPVIPKAPTPPRLSESERREMARRLMERRGLSSRAPRLASSSPPGGRPSGPAPVPSSAPGSSGPPRTRSSYVEGLTKSLKATARLTGGVDKARRHIDDADAKVAAKDLVGAINSLKMARAVDPDREGLRARHDELRAELAAQMAETYRRQAAYEEEHGNWEAAARSWQKVAEGRSEDHRSRRKAAEALLMASGDLRKARNLAQEAVQLAPTSVKNRVALARVYAAAKMKVSATKELAEAVKLDPDAEIVKTLQRELK